MYDAVDDLLRTNWNSYLDRQIRKHQKPQLPLDKDILLHEHVAAKAWYHSINVSNTLLSFQVNVDLADRET